jgi:hypothetical protein
MKHEMRDLLRRVTFKVDDSGTAFAVSRTLLVTCRHVVANTPVGGEVTVTPQLGKPRTALVLRRLPEANAGPGGDKWPDLALLEVPVQDALDISAVLDTQRLALGEPAVIAGFPEGQEVGYVTRDYVGGSDDNFVGGHRYPLLTGEPIDPGMSGAAVVSDAGFVCGYIRLTRGSKTPLGGYFVPLEEVLADVPELAEAYKRPDVSAKEWLAHFDVLDLKYSHGRDTDGARLDADDKGPNYVDIVVKDATRPVRDDDEAPINKWTVVASGLHSRFPRKLGDLGEGVLEALDYWSRRNHFVEKSQVDLLGHVLARGLSIDKIAQHVRDLGSAQPALIRLRMARGRDPLTAIPWEYADELATSLDWAFSRYVEQDKPSVVPIDQVRALVVVNAIEGIETDELAGGLRGYLGRSNPHIAFSVESNVKTTDLQRLVTQRWDIVHIVATAHSNGTIEAPQELKTAGTADWDTLVRHIAKARAKVVVLQLATPRFEAAPTIATFFDVFGRPDSTAGAAGANDVNALVVVQHITSSEHIEKFCTPFYASIHQGDSVEMAVQNARNQVQIDPPDSPHGGKDYAAFGAISVATTSTGHVRILTRLTTDGARVTPGEGEPKAALPVDEPASPRQPAAVSNADKRNASFG